jgi:NAD(P) transhydrogenase subunit alpha
MDVRTVGVVRETAPAEHRVALAPDGTARLRELGLEVLVEQGAGRLAWFPDEAYLAGGADVVDRARLLERADIVLCVHPPDPRTLREGQALVGLLAPALNPELVTTLAEAKVTAFSLDGLPRTLSRAQAMDALTSQANIAGYKAAVLAADTYGGYFPMLMTAAGTVRPATVLVLGAGVAGLQAISTARRLGASVTGYDVRPAARDEVRSTGAAFLDLGQLDSGDTAATGYAREQSAAEQQAQQEKLSAAIGTFDVVITTAQVPGRRPPLLVSAAALAALRPGSVVVDLAASSFGGNVESSAPDRTIVTEHGVTVIGAGNLPSTMPQAASTAYSRNITALLAHLVDDGTLAVDPDEEIQAGVLVTHDGHVAPAYQPTGSN